MISHTETNNHLVSLHDCRAAHLECRGGVLILSFPDGIWLLPEHPSNPTSKGIKTQAAQVFFHLDSERDAEIYVFRETLLGQTLREAWSLDQLIAFINSGQCQIEFIIDYHSRSFAAYLYKCVLVREGAGGEVECEIALPASQAVYQWNEITAGWIM